MTKKTTKHSLLMSAVSLLLCISMLIGTTYAWFTDEVVSGMNQIVAGNLDVELLADGKKVTESTKLFDDVALWEPGVVVYENLQVVNEGSLALKWQMAMNFGSENDLEGHKLSEVLRVAVIDKIENEDRASVLEAAKSANATSLYNFYMTGSLEADTAAEEQAVVIFWEPSTPEIDNLYNANNGKTTSDGEPLRIEFGVKLVATQEMSDSEKDSFGFDYDADALFPAIHGGSVTVNVPVTNGYTTEETAIAGDGFSAIVPAGVKVADGVSALTLTIREKDSSDANVTLEENEELRPLDVHIEGVASDNDKPILVTIERVMAKGLNMGNYTLYHVENGASNAMTLTATPANHNDFHYEPTTGDVVLALKSFSEVAAVANSEKAWEGEFDYTWYDASETELFIANADQLAAFGAIVGGMKKVTDRVDGAYTYSEEVIQDSFEGKIVKLISDVNLGDKESENNPNLIFYPIGYWNNEGTYERKPLDERKEAVSSGFYTFNGTFDGNGHTVSNFYQNTWEMKGDHDWYDTVKEQYYRDGMGLFGRVYGGTVKNLTVKNFSSDGEIATTGVIAAYADGATFENIAIFNCNPRVYNIGNGGIVGCVGWYAKEADLKTTFKNITVDNSNKISALWGSYDVPCGGILGQYYPTSGQTSAGTPKNAGLHFENCHVSAQLDVYNDVCANYQYYAYRYAGMLIGSVRENETIDGHVYPKMKNITAENCTVHFGTWNDYYYCEIIDNTTASYTHDYQMSRLTEIKAINGTTITYLDGTTGTVPASGRANYVIVDYSKGHGTENATCYHFKDGAVWTHDMGGIQTGIDENGDGQDDLKEDKQHIYLEFNNLVTGYGWGVTTKVVGNLEGVTILDRAEGNSVVKFAKADTAKENYTRGSTVEVGELFKAAEIKDEKLSIKGDKVHVTVSPSGAGSTAGGTYVADTTDWKKGKLTFTGAGAAEIIITDYYFCKETKITVTVSDGGFLYRVGNKNSITKAQLSNLLTSKSSANVEIVGYLTPQNGTYEPNGDNVKFNDTGIVKLKIDGVLYHLEVVDAVNATTATSATANNVVLLQNTTASSLTVSNGYAFYGNGFEIKFNGDGSYRSAAVSYGFVTLENGGTLDNARVICKVFPKSYMFTSEMTAGSDGRYPYGYSAIVVSGNSTISNCYIYGARNNIQIGAGNVKIQNTVTECGSLSNIHIKSASGDTVTLDNVTTIQRKVPDDFGAESTMLGFGILVGDNKSENYPTIQITGDLKQYNWVGSKDADGVSNTYAKQAINGALDNMKYVHTLAGVSKINLGIVFLTTVNTDIQDKRADSIQTQVPYLLNNVTISTYTGQVYSVKAGSQVAESSRYDAETDGVIPYVPSTQNVIAPQILHSDVNGSSLTIATAFDKEWITTFTADLDNIAGGSYNFKFSDLVVKKYGKELSYTIKDSSGNAVDKSTEITLSQLYTGEYTLIVTDNVIYNRNGQLSSKTVTREMPFVLYSTKTSIEPPKFTNAGTATAIRLVDKKGGDWRPAYTVLTGVNVTYWSASESKVKTVDLSTLYKSGTISSNVWTYTCDDYTLTITGGNVHSDGTTITPVVSNNTLYFASTNKAFTTNTTSRDIKLTYVFTDKNASTTWNRTEKVTYSELSEYDYSKFKNGTLEAPSSGGGGGCVTGDTLVTLADGSKKMAKDVTSSDLLLVWDFYNGTYAKVPAALMINHGDGFWNVISLKFEDGTVVNAVTAHAFFDTELNRTVLITPENAKDFIGHSFAKATGTACTSVKLVDCSVVTKYTDSYSLVSAIHYNFIVEDMISYTNLVPDLFAGLEVGDDMKYDVETLKADIEKYGLYTYEDFSQYLTEEQFNALNGAYMKISVGKNYVTYEEIVGLIINFVK